MSVIAVTDYYDSIHVSTIATMIHEIELTLALNLPLLCPHYDSIHVSTIAIMIRDIGLTSRVWR
jgi:hypothetical protein